MRNLASGCESGQCQLRKVRACRPWLEFALWASCDFDGAAAVGSSEKTDAASRLLAPFTRRDEECYDQVGPALPTLVAVDHVRRGLGFVADHPGTSA